MILQYMVDTLLVLLLHQQEKFLGVGGDDDSIPLRSSGSLRSAATAQTSLQRGS